MCGRIRIDSLGNSAAVHPIVLVNFSSVSCFADLSFLSDVFFSSYLTLQSWQLVESPLELPRTSSES